MRSGASSGRCEFRDRFAPQRLHRWFGSVSEALDQTIRSNIYRSNDLRYSERADAVLLVGTIVCEGGLRIEVEEHVRVLREPWFSRLPWFHQTSNPLVVLSFYTYSAVLLKRGSLFRYDSPHQAHRQFHHVHRFDALGSGAETEVTELGEREVPTLREVVKEAADWHWLHQSGKQT